MTDELLKIRIVKVLKENVECLKEKKSTMPVDSRRLQGPETAFSYSLLEEKDVDKPPIQKSLLKPNGKRKDGRKPTDSRPLCILSLFYYFQIKIILFFILKFSFENRSSKPS